ncbi:peptidylprolyl isomerase [Urechidicola sp. KH5]
MKDIKMMKRGLLAVCLCLSLLSVVAQRAKVDGVIVVIGKNIVLDSDVEKFKLEVEQRSEGKIKISDCEMLEEIMLQKLLSHHAVIDSIVVDDSQVEGQVERSIAMFTQQLGSMDKVVEFYGFNDEDDLRKELAGIQKEQLLIQQERASITEEVDVTPDEVRTYYNNLKDADVLPEFGAEVEISQIVVYAEPTEEEIKRVKDKLIKLKNEIEGGASMKMKAILNSDDPSVSSQGPGEGGFFTITRESGFVKEFKEVAFSLDEGQISEPFKSDFGYHIVKVEKIKGQEIDVRHILIQPNIDSEKLNEAKRTLEKVRADILKDSITFEEAVKQFSEEEITKDNKGIIINGQTGDSKFELTRMDPTLYQRIANVKQDELTEPFYDETREGEKMFKIMLVKSRTESHTADFVKDYVKIQQLALQKKQEEAIEDWADDKLDDTYIKINDEFKDCEFSRNWTKKEN